MKSIEDFNELISPNSPKPMESRNNAYKDYLRVEISAMAMQGILAEGYFNNPTDKAISECSTKLADALIKQLEI